MSRPFNSVAMVALLTAACMLPAVANAQTTSTTESQESVSAVPAGFAPSSTSWPSADRGWVLGIAPCPTGSCPVLLHTTDGGASWKPQPAPPVHVGPSQLRVRVSFADGNDGFVTNGHQVFATHDGARSWREVSLPDTPGTPTIRGLETNSDHAYAIVATGTGDAARTRLYSSDLERNSWHPVPNVAIDGHGGWDVAAAGDAGEVALGQVYRSSRYWTSSDGTAWQQAPAPCPTSATTRLDDSGTLPLVFALCSSNPQRGHMRKQLALSMRGLPFTFLGPAPYPGITTGFAVASPTTIAVSATGGGQSLLFMTFDGGQTWETVLVRSGAGFRDLDFQDARHGVTVVHAPNSAAGVYRTEDGGHTWYRLPVGKP